MLRITELKLPLDHPDEALREAIVQRLGIRDEQLLSFNLFKRSYDARKKNTELLFIYTIDLTASDEAALLRKFADDHNITQAPDVSYKPVGQAPADLAERPIVVGFGPCGIFAGLLLAQMGFKPIILERGKEVRQRTKDTWGLWRKSVLNPESNVQFGEGGAGTFSDGKLYSQIKDPKHHGRKVLHEFVKAGAPEEILYVSKPHIGTFRLTGVVENMREQIRALGGEVRFQQRVGQAVDVEAERETGDQHAVGQGDVVGVMGRDTADPRRAALLAPALDLAAEEVEHRGETADGIGRAGAPGAFAFGGRGGRVSRGFLVMTDQRVVRGGLLGVEVIRGLDGHRHVRLARAEPDFAHEYVFYFELMSFLAGHDECPRFGGGLEGI